MRRDRRRESPVDPSVVRRGGTAPTERSACWPPIQPRTPSSTDDRKEVLMSVGSQELERSTLEAKDRESLHQIATAMGGKPGSRAKKADIITMILKLAGVTDPGPGSSPAPAADNADQPDTTAEGQLPLDAASPATDEDSPSPSGEAQPASTNGNGHPVSEAPAGSGGGDAERNGNADARHDDQRDQA